MQSELSRVVDALPGLIWTALEDGHVDFVSQGWCEYTGCNADDARGNGWLVAVHPDDRARHFANWQSVRSSGAPGEMETRLRRFDGEYRRFLIRIRPLSEPDGRVRWCGVNTDIEDCRRSEEDARSREDELRSIIDSIPACIALTTPAGAIEYVNRQTLEYLGAPLEELRRWSTAGTVHPDDVASVVAAWTHSVRTGEPYDIEHRIRRADGTYRWFHVRGLPLRDGRGRIVRWCVVETDIDDHKRDKALIAEALDEVRTSEDRLRTIVDAMPGFVWSATPEGSADFFNQRWCDYTGIEMTDAFGSCWQLTIHPDDTDQLRAHWQSLLESGEAGEAEARLRRHDGTYRWFLIRTDPLRDSTGRLVKWYGQNTDIEERKRAEMLLAGEKRVLGMMAGGSSIASILEALCELVESMIDGSLCSVVLVDPRRIRRSQQASQLIRLQSGAAPHLPACLLEGTDGRPLDEGFDPVATAVTRNEQVIVPDLAHEGRWGSWCSKAVSHGLRANWSIPIQSTTGATLGVLSILHRERKVPTATHQNFITQFTQLASIAIERARGEAALKQSEAFLAKAQQLSLTGTFSWHVPTDEIAWSEEVYRIYELDPAITPTFDLIDARLHPDDMQSHHGTIEHQRKAGTDFEHEHRLLMPDGSVKYLYLVAHATRDENGGLTYIAAVQDVTQRRLSEEVLGKVRSELAHVARVATLGAVTASIAHEVNQPLAGIITNASTCLRMLGSEPPNIDGARETARRTIRDGNRASDVIKRLRALFVNKEVTAEAVDLNEATREVIAMLVGELQRSGVVIHPELDNDLPSVLGDRVQLQQVILNLLANAAEAMHGVANRSRHLVIRTCRDGDLVRLAVQDTGAGFDADDAERLFQAFYTTKNEGMGIGLSISRSIIESHSGRLWATRNDGPGATFSFAIPCFSHGMSNSRNGAARSVAEKGPHHVVEHH